MTRREEVELAWLNKAVQSSHRYDEKSFKEGVEWADKTMIDKACRWLSRNAKDYVSAFFNEGILQDKLLLKHFRKKMLEEE